MNLENAKNIVDTMYQNKMNERIEKSTGEEIIHLGIEVGFSELEEASVRLLRAVIKLERENEELKEDNLEYQRIQDAFDERCYRKKYLEERRAEEDLLYPDADEVYERYFKQREMIQNLEKENEKLKAYKENIIHDILEVLQKLLN